MIISIETYRILDEKMEEFKALIKEHTMPMFQQFDGLKSIFVSIDEKQSISKMITIWQDEKCLRNKDFTN